MDSHEGTKEEIYEFGIANLEIRNPKSQIRNFSLRAFVAGFMSKVQIDTPAPDFTLNDFDDNPVTLSEFRSKSHVVLVFNRGFI